MFNATNGKIASDQRIEALSDQLAADATSYLSNPAIPRAKKEAAIEAAAAIFADPDSLDQLGAGTFAQNNQGRPAAAIGTGQQPTTEQEALAFLLESGSLPSGMKQALKRLLNPADPDHISVGADGTPSEVGSLRQQVLDLTVELQKERDPQNHGSIAHQLAAAQAAGNPANTISKADATSALDTIKTAVEGLQAKPGLLRGVVDSQPALDAVEAARRNLGL